MRDMILPVIGTVLEYTAILSVTFNRYDLLERIRERPFGEVGVIILTYLMCILIVSFWCRLKPFNMIIRD